MQTNPSRTGGASITHDDIENATRQFLMNGGYIQRLPERDKKLQRQQKEINNRYFRKHK